MDPRDLLILGDKLLSIDEEKFRQVVQLLERMNDHPDVQKTIDAIRPRLVELRIRRRPTLKRLFCDPFEDLFEAYGKPTGEPLARIERLVMNGVWPLVEDEIGKERMAGFASALIPGPQRDGQADAFWSAAAAAVAGIAARTSERGRAAPSLGFPLDNDRVRQIKDMATILSIAPEIRKLKAVISSKPLPKLHPDHLEGIQDIGRRVSKGDAASLRGLVLVAASRLADPSGLLSGLWNMDFSLNPKERAALFGELGGTVVTQIEERSRLMTGPAGEAANRLAVADLAVNLVASLEATKSAMEQSRNKDFDQRLKEIRSSVHQAVKTQVLEGADTSILNALASLGSSGNDQEQLKSAESQARALRKCAVIADKLGLKGELKTVTQNATSSLVDKARKILGNPAAAASEPGGARAGYTAVRMIELIAGPAEANKVMDEILNGGNR